MTNTLHSINEYDYTGQSNFVAPSHQQASDIVVLVNDVVKTQGTDYTLTGSLVAFTGFTPSNGDKISIRRETASAARQVDFASGSMLKAETLDQDSNQIFNIAQEALDKAEMIGGDYNARYYGASTAAPTSPAPSDGDLWFDTSGNVMKVYSSSESSWSALTFTTADQANIDTVAGISSEVQTVATNVSLIDGISADVAAVAAINTEVSTVAGISGAVEKAAENATGINHYGRTFLGSSTTAPTVHSDGASIGVGAFWFDSGVNILKVYQANGWQNAALGISNPVNRKSFVATSGQTAFPMDYQAGHLDVYLNGVKLVESTIPLSQATASQQADANGNVTATIKLTNNNYTDVYLNSDLWGWSQSESQMIASNSSGNMTVDGEATLNDEGDWVWTYQVPAGSSFEYKWLVTNSNDATGFEDLTTNSSLCASDFITHDAASRVYHRDITDTYGACHLTSSGI